jgi:type I restriction enzyme, S subunit
VTTYSGKDFWREHPTKWPTVPLRKVARLGTGHTPSRSVPEYWENCTIPWLTTEDLTSRRGVGPLEPVMETRQLISELGLANSAAELHPADTVMLSRTASVGHVARVGKPMATTQAFVTWTCSEALDPRYLTVVLLAMNPEFFRLAYGSTHLTIYMPDIEQLRVPLPPLAEQREIASHVNAETARIDAVIAKKQKLIRLLDERRTAAIDDAVTTVDGPSVPVRRLSSRITSGPRGWADFVSDTGTPFVRITNIQRDRIDLDMSDILRVDAPQSAESSRTRVRTGDVLVSITADIGSVGLVAAELDGSNISQHVALVRPRNCEPEWLAYAIRSTPARFQLDSGQYGGTKTQLSLEDIASLRVPYPDITTQRRQLARLRHALVTLDVCASRLRIQTDLLFERRQAQISAAVTGALAVLGDA